MLPFLKLRKQDGGVITQVRQPDEDKEQNDDYNGLEVCAKDLIDAIKSEDHKAVASAIKAAFEILDSMPHAEGPHTNE